MEIVTVKTKVLIIGGGLAGLCAALRAKELCSNVTILAKGRVGLSGNSTMTRNGMAAVLNEGYDDDTFAHHITDTLKGGAGLNDKGLVRIFAENAPDAISYLTQQGVPFLTENQQLLRKGSPGHSHKRFLTVDGHAAKSPYAEGLALVGPLSNKIRKAKINIFNRILVTELLTSKDGRVVGAIGLDKERERSIIFLSKSTILATGGGGRLFLNNTNAFGATGDGYALADSVGAKLVHMEFIQFHPAVAMEEARMTMSTSIFADGAVLKNANGAAFMTHYSEKGDMATRDVMARAVYMEIKAGRGTEDGRVYLDFSKIPQNFLVQKYGPLATYLKNRNIIRVAPSAHFMMGGVRVDSKCRTNVAGLFAAGEVAGGVHGANRLAGNALTEAAVFGLRAGAEAARQAIENNNEPAEGLGNLHLKDKYYFNNLAEGIGSRLSDIKKKLYTKMNDKVGIVRDENGLKSAILSFGGKPQASLLGEKFKIDISHAALANGIILHALDFDDYHRETVAHATASCLPALLALAEHRKLPGKDILTALVVGIDITIRLSHGLGPHHYAIGWHPTATAGRFGVTAAACNLLGLDADKTVNAFGICGTQASGLRQVFGTMSKPFNAGKAAMDGLMSALLAEIGFTSSKEIIEGKLGILDVMAKDPNKKGILERIGIKYHIMDISIKPYPTCA